MEDIAFPADSCLGWHPGLPADLSGDKALGPAHGVGPQGLGGSGRALYPRLPALARRRSRERWRPWARREGVMLVLQLQQLGAHPRPHTSAEEPEGHGPCHAPPIPQGRSPRLTGKRRSVHQGLGRSGQPHVPQAAPPGAPVGREQGAAEVCVTCGLISPLRPRALTWPQ